MFNGRRQPSCGGTSWMTRECQVRICERLGVKFPGPTRLSRPFTVRQRRGRSWKILRTCRYPSGTSQSARKKGRRISSDRIEPFALHNG